MVNPNQQKHFAFIVHISRSSSLLKVPRFVLYIAAEDLMLSIAVAMGNRAEASQKASLEVRLSPLIFILSLLTKTILRLFRAITYVILRKCVPASVWHTGQSREPDFGIP
jgi:hypothetical protein